MIDVPKTETASPASTDSAVRPDSSLGATAEANAHDQSTTDLHSPPVEAITDSKTSKSVDDARHSELLFRMLQAMRPGVQPEQFYRAFLATIIEACSAKSVCVWQVQEGQISPAFHTGFDAIGLKPGSDTWKLHESIVTGAASKGLTAAVPGRATTEWGQNPIAAELIFVPITHSKQVVALVEVVIQSSLAEHTSPQWMALRMKEAQSWCSLFTEYVYTRDAMTRSSQSTTDRALRQFISSLHASSTRDEVAYTIVNECRSLFGCDRVSLGWMRSGRVDIYAVSGQEKVDSRSSVVRVLRALAETAIRTGESYRKTFPSDSMSSTEGVAKSNSLGTEEHTEPHTNPIGSSHSSAPRPSSKALKPSAVAFERILDDYPSDHRSKSLLVLPLPIQAAQEKCGAIILEQFRSESVPMLPASLVEVSTEQICIALQRADTLASIPGLSLWQRRARYNRLQSSRKLWLGLALTLISVLSFIPIELHVPATGTLQATSRRSVFAPEDGIVREVLVKQGDFVTQGQPLLLLENLELSTMKRDLTGQIHQANERRRAIEARRVSPQSTEKDQLELQGTLAEIDSIVQSLERQASLIDQRLDHLRITASEPGMITSTTPEQSLLNKPCRQGEKLLQQIDPKNSWQIEAMIPEGVIGHVIHRMNELGADSRLPVDFVLATDPEVRHQGFLSEISPSTELYGSVPAIRAVVELNPNELLPLRDGATVSVRFYCGKHPAAFVVFRELIEALQRNWWL